MYGVNRGCIIVTAFSCQMSPDLVEQIDGTEVTADAGCAMYEIAVDVGPKCPSRTAEVAPACATAVLMSGKVWPIGGTDPHGRKTTYGAFAAQKVPYVM